MPTAFMLDHIVIVCSDIETSLAWYQKHAGLAPVNVDEWRAGKAFFPSLRVNDDTIIDFISGLEQGAERGHVDHIFFVVAPGELDGVRNEPELTIVDEGPRSGARGIGDSVYVRDPDGLLVEFRHYRAD